MRILFVNEYIYPNVVSGAEFSMLTLAEALSKKGEEIIFFGPNLSKNKINFYKNIKILSFPFPKKILPYQTLSPFWFNNPIFWLYSAIFLIFTSIREKIDIIHVHGKYLLPAAIIVKIFLKIPVVVTVRDYKFLCPLALCLVKQGKVCDWNYFLREEIKFYLSKYEGEKSCLSKFFLSLRIFIGKLLQKALFSFLKSADKIIFVSQAILEIHQKAGLENKKLMKIYNLSPETRSLFKTKSIKKIVLYVGKLSFGKGTDILVKAMGRVRKKLPGAKLVLVGKKSPSIDSLPKFASYYEQIPHEKVLKFYQKASVFVLPSRWPEPLSRSTLEALSAGLPLILSDRGGNREVVVDNVNGYLVSLDPEQLARKILSILQNPKKQAKMSKKSLELLKTRFNRKKIVDQHFKLYSKLVIRKWLENTPGVKKAKKL